MKKTILFLFGSSTFITALAGTLMEGPNLPFGQMGQYMVSTPTQLITMGGHGQGFVSLKDFAVIDKTSLTVSSGRLLYPHDSPCLAKLQDGSYLIAGGSLNLGIPHYSDAEIFNPVTQTSLEVGKLVRFRADGGAAALTSGKVLIAGAWWNHNDAHTIGEIYDPASKSFQATGPLAQPRSMPVVLPTSDGNAVVVGGTSYQGSVLEAAPELYNAVENKFTLLRRELFPNEAGWSLIGYRNPVETFRADDGNYYLVAYRIQAALTSYQLTRFDPDSKEFTKVGAVLEVEAGAQVFSPVALGPQVAILAVAYPGDGAIAVKMIYVDVRSGKRGLDSAALANQNVYVGPSYSTVSPISANRFMIAGSTSRDNFTATPKTWILESTPQWEGEEDSVTLSLYPGIRVYGTLGATYTIEYAESPATNTWFSLGSLILTNQGQLYIDTTVTNQAKRFYRTSR